MFDGTRRVFVLVGWMFFILGSQTVIQLNLVTCSHFSGSMKKVWY